MGFLPTQQSEVSHTVSWHIPAYGSYAVPLGQPVGEKPEEQSSSGRSHNRRFERNVGGNRAKNGERMNRRRSSTRLANDHQNSYTKYTAQSAHTSRPAHMKHVLARGRRCRPCTAANECATQRRRLAACAARASGTPLNYSNMPPRAVSGGGPSHRDASDAVGNGAIRPPPAPCSRPVSLHEQTYFKIGGKGWFMFYLLCGTQQVDSSQAPTQATSSGARP